MSTEPTVNDLVLDNWPRGIPFVIHDAWAPNVTPTVEADPETGYNMRVSEVHFWIDTSLVLTHYVQINGLTDGQSGSTYTRFADIDELLMAADQIVMNKATPDRYHAIFKIQPSVVLTDAGAETFSIQEATTTEAITGELWIMIKGWTYDEDEEG